MEHLVTVSLTCSRMFFHSQNNETVSTVDTNVYIINLVGIANGEFS